MGAPRGEVAPDDEPARARLVNDVQHVPIARELAQSLVQRDEITAYAQSLDPGVIVPQVGGMPMELLVDAPSFGALTATHGGQGHGAMTFTLDLPRDPALVGLDWAAQGLVMSSHTDLSSAVRGTVQAPLGGN